MEENQMAQIRTPEQVIAEEQFRRAGHAAENPNCDHTQWDWNKHGRYCTCGTPMVDLGD